MNIQARIKLQRGNFILDVNLSVPANGITTVFGASGSGKTTLLRTIAGLERSNDGVVTVDGETWQDDGFFLPVHKRPIGFVFQEANLFPHLTVRGNIEYGYRRLAEAQRILSIDEVVSFLNIQTLLKRNTKYLSGGERQRVAIARALLTSPRLLLMDEPLVSLDIKSKLEIYPLIERLNREMEIPVLFVSHSVDEVARLADNIVLMDNGRITEIGHANEMFTRLDLPFSSGPDAESIVEGIVKGYEEEFNISNVEFAGGIFSVAGNRLPDDRKVRLRIMARDVSLTLDKQVGTSILNIFPAEIQDITQENPSQVTVKLTVNGVALLSRITKKSANMLNLEKGKKVYAQVKSVALLA